MTTKNAGTFAYAPIISVISSLLLIGVLIATLVLLKLPELYLTASDTTKKYATVKAASTSIDSVTTNPDSIDGVDIVAGDRVLFMDEPNARQNGIYVKTASGYERSSDMNTAEQLATGDRVYIVEGKTYAGAVSEMGASMIETSATDPPDSVTGKGLVFNIVYRIRTSNDSILPSAVSSELPTPFPILTVMRPPRLALPLLAFS